MLTYVASPYSPQEGEPKAIRAYRYNMVKAYIALVYHNGAAIKRTFYSPIVHFHSVAEEYGLPTDADFWWNDNEAMLDKADEMVILGLQGWQTSKGLTHEISYATKRGIPITLMVPTREGWLDMGWDDADEEVSFMEVIEE